MHLKLSNLLRLVKSTQFICHANKKLSKVNSFVSNSIGNTILYCSAALQVMKPIRNIVWQMFSKLQTFLAIFYTLYRLFRTFRFTTNHYSNIKWRIVFFIELFVILLGMSLNLNKDFCMVKDYLKTVKKTVLNAWKNMNHSFLQKTI